MWYIPYSSGCYYAQREKERGGGGRRLIGDEVIGLYTGGEKRWMEGWMDGEEGGGREGESE